jgi:hypothetical protein
VIARYKSQLLTQRHSLVCPSLIPLSPVALRNYERETSEQLKEWLRDIQYVNSRVGLMYNLYPAKDQGIDNSQSIGMGDLKNVMEDKITAEMKIVV